MQSCGSGGNILIIKKIYLIMNLIERLLSSLIDFLIISLLSIPFAIAEIIIVFYNDSNCLYCNVIAFSIISTLLLCKDLLLTNSYGKRFCGFTILNKKEDCQIKPYTYVLRNITYFIWPIELIFMLTNNGQKIGDIMSGTKVVSLKNKNVIANKEIPISDKVEITTVTLILHLVIFFALVYFLQKFIPVLRLL